MALFRSRNAKLPSSWRQTLTSSISNFQKSNKHRPAVLLAVLLFTPLVAVSALRPEQLADEGNSETANSRPSEPAIEEEPAIETVQESTSAQPSTVRSSSSSVRNDSKAQIEINVNGEQIQVPANSSVHRVIEHANGNGQTVVEARVNQSGSSSSFTHSVSTSVISSSSNGENSISIEDN